MTYHGRDVDYSEEKARIDATGFDALKAMAHSCDLCGGEIKEDEVIVEVSSLEFCETCTEQARLEKTVDFVGLTKSVLGIK